MTKKKLLFLAHRLPYPPNKGDKIASFNLLRFLADRYRVFLGTLIDDPDDRQYRDEVRRYCEDLCAPEISPTIARIASLRGLLSGEALSLPYLRNRELYAWTTQVLREQHPERIVIFSGPMAQYVSGRVPEGATTLFDMVDVDSEKWRSYAERKPWPMSALYRREADRLLAFERRVARELDSTVFVSEEEADLFRSLAPECAAKITYRIQGVDSDFFDPSCYYPDPFPVGAPALVFTGAMDYWPNVDAVGWFAEAAWPSIRRQVPNARFFIVGMRPTPEVSRLAEQPGITVTGAVPDVRPYLAHAHAAVLPLRIARGIQNKVLEAMAMRLPIIGTAGALTGIAPCAGFEPIISESADTLADSASRLLQQPRRADSAARECVLQRYNWDANLQRILRLLETGKVEPDLRQPSLP